MFLFLKNPVGSMSVTKVAVDEFGIKTSVA